MALRSRKTDSPESDMQDDDPHDQAATTAGDNLGIVVGQNIKRLRSRRNLSLEGLAKISGVSRAMLGQIETGRSVTSPAAGSASRTVSSLMQAPQRTDAGGPVGVADRR